MRPNKQLVIEDIKKIYAKYFPNLKIDEKKLIKHLSLDKEINWIRLSYEIKLSEDFIAHFVNFVYWKNITKYQTLSESFIEEYSDHIYWNWVDYNRTLSEEFIKRNLNKLNIEFLIETQNLSNEFIQFILKNIDVSNVPLNKLAESGKLSSNDIDKYYTAIYPGILIRKYILPEYIFNYLTELNTYEIWKAFSLYYPLSDEQIRKHKNSLCLNCLLQNDKVELTEELYAFLMQK